MHVWVGLEQLQLDDGIGVILQSGIMSTMNRTGFTALVRWGHRNFHLVAGTALWTVAIGISLSVTLLLNRNVENDLGRAEAETAYQQLALNHASLMGSTAHLLPEPIRGFRGHVTALNSVSPASQPD